MTVRTIPLAQFAVMLRKPFAPLLAADGSPVGDRKTGEPIFLAEAAAPGLVRFGTEDRTSEVRIKVLGTMPTMSEGSVVDVLGGKLTVWSQRGARGASYRSDVTVSADTVRLASAGTIPTVRGGFPAHYDGNRATYLGQTFGPDGTPRTITLMFDPVGVFAVSGITEVQCATTIPESLLAAPVAVHNLRAYFTRPDADDVGQRNKTELVLGCSHVTALPTEASNGNRRPKSDTPNDEPAPVG